MVQYVHLLIKMTQQERKDDTEEKKDNSGSKILKQARGNSTDGGAIYMWLTVRKGKKLNRLFGNETGREKRLDNAKGTCLYF